MQPLIIGGIAAGFAYLASRSGSESVDELAKAKRDTRKSATSVKTEGEVLEGTDVLVDENGVPIGATTTTDAGTQVSSGGESTVTEPGFVMEDEGNVSCSTADGKPISCIELEKRLRQAVEAGADPVF